MTETIHVADLQQDRPQTCCKCAADDVLLSILFSKNSSVAAMANPVLERLKVYEEERAFLRQLTIPEEDRYLFTSCKWSGEYRWFRSDNVICLEKVRHLRTMRSAGA